MTSLTPDRVASNGDSPGAARPDPTTSSSPRPEHDPPAETAAAPKAELKPKKPAAEKNHDPDPGLPVFYVSSLAASSRPYLLVFEGEGYSVSEWIGANFDYERVGFLPNDEAGGLTAVEVEALAMERFGGHDGDSGRPVHAEWPETDPVGATLGKVAVEILRIQDRAANDPHQEDGVQPCDYSAYDIARRLRLNKQDVEDAMKKLLPEPRLKRKRKPQCPLCGGDDDFGDGLCYDEVLAGRLAVKLFREREGVFPPEVVGVLMNSVDRLAVELRTWPESVREVLAVLIGPGRGAAEAKEEGAAAEEAAA